MGLPRTDDKKYYSEVISAMESAITNINTQAKLLLNQDDTNLPIGSVYKNSYGNFSSNELYEEIKRATTEIFSINEDLGSYKDETYQFIIKYAVLFSAIATPAIVKYTNSKLEKIYTELYKNIQAELNSIMIRINNLNSGAS